MLVQLVFSSVATQESTTDSESILKQGRLHNQARGITGVLCHGYGTYLEALEGERSAVNAVYANILRDKRHRHVQLLDYEEISVRRFPHWSLGSVNLECLNRSTLLKYTCHWPLNAQEWQADSATAFLQDMLDSASILAK